MRIYRTFKDLEATEKTLKKVGLLKPLDILCAPLHLGAKPSKAAECRKQAIFTNYSDRLGAAPECDPRVKECNRDFTPTIHRWLGPITWSNGVPMWHAPPRQVGEERTEPSTTLHSLQSTFVAPGQ